MEILKEELEKMILQDKLSYREIGRKYGVSDTCIKKTSIRLGIKLEVRSKFPVGFKPYNFGKAIREKCKCCGNLIDSSKPANQIFCSEECDKKFKVSENYKYYLEHQKEFCYVNNMTFIKRHLLKEQHNKCDICKIINKWNNKELIFVLDHIDESADNNLRENLRLICSNCDSQLDTYKSKNKNSSRKERYLKNYKN